MWDHKVSVCIFVYVVYLYTYYCEASVCACKSESLTDFRVGIMKKKQ